MADATVKINKDAFGDQWPFSVDEGILERRGMMVLFHIGQMGETYGLNGFATLKGFDLIDEIWLDNPDIPGTKISLTPIFNTI